MMVMAMVIMLTIKTTRMMAMTGEYIFQGIRHLGLSPCASENLTVLELDNCPLITDTRYIKKKIKRITNTPAEEIRKSIVRYS